MINEVRLSWLLLGDKVSIITFRQELGLHIRNWTNFRKNKYVSKLINDFPAGLASQNKTDDTNILYSKIMKITTKVLFDIDKMNNFDSADFNFSLNFSQKWQIKWQKFVWTYRVLNIIEGLRIPNILEICYLYNLFWKYIEKYISIDASILCVCACVRACACVFCLFVCIICL
jgi:hypothetical protein